MPRRKPAPTKKLTSAKLEDWESQTIMSKGYEAGMLKMIRDAAQAAVQRVWDNLAKKLGYDSTLAVHRAGFCLRVDHVAGTVTLVPLDPEAKSDPEDLL